VPQSIISGCAVKLLRRASQFQLSKDNIVHPCYTQLTLLMNGAQLLVSPAAVIGSCPFSTGAWQCDIYGRFFSSFFWPT